MNGHGTSRRVAALAGAALVAVLAAGCGSSGADKASGGQTLDVKLVDTGCSPSKLTAKAGSVTIHVTNGGTSKVSELELKNRQGIILGERENIVSGIDASFSLKLAPGTYVLSCPTGDTEDNGRLVVTGKAAASSSAVPPALLAKATAGYRAYVVAQADELLTGTKRFVAALDEGRLQEAQDLFGPVRLHYEAIEPVAESFGNLDPQIDARVNDVASPSEWTGFHRIEQILWVKKTTAGTEPYAKKLLADVTRLDKRVRTLELQPAQLANGAVELLNEVAGSKITGEEDRYSHTDLSDFQGNLTGAEKAFRLLRPALTSTGDEQLAATIATRFAAVQKGLDKYKRTTPLGFAPYSALTPADRRTFAQQVDALAEPLSTVAAKVSS
ncbi:MAG TPA: iron uptake system protein EfeO [Gaiellaceae bacterium]|nr:iron uptake system protein EfeO [Gaiellaceae bacterium]